MIYVIIVLRKGNNSVTDQRKIMEMIWSNKDI